MWLAASFVGAIPPFAAVTSCGEVSSHRAERSLTSTVTLRGETRLIVDSLIPIEIRGERRLDEIRVVIDATLTASTSTRANAAAEKLSFDEAHPDARTVTLSLAAPEDALLTGTFRLEVPADMDVKAVERASTVFIEGMDGAIDVTSVSHVRVVEASKDVRVNVGRGNALVDATLTPGSTVDVRVRAGDVELRVPEALSADIEATFATEGAIITDHARLPPFFGTAGQPYRASVGGGLSIVRIATGTGRIVIRSRS